VIISYFIVLIVARTTTTTTTTLLIMCNAPFIVMKICIIKNNFLEKKWGWGRGSMVPLAPGCVGPENAPLE